MTRSKFVKVATSMALSLGIAASMAVTLGAEAFHQPALVWPNNLLPNSSFEFGIADVTPQPQYTNSQPLLPQGWAFEGNAGLFDHSQNEHNSGRRMAAISIPLGGKRQICEAGPIVPCQQSPLNVPKDTARQYYSVNPAWRTLNPVNVSAGSSYNLKVYAARSFVTAGEGAFTAVRWLNALGQPIGYQPVSELRGSTISTDWTLMSGSAVAPTGATKAHILLGHTDDTFLGQVRFDDVCFGGC